MFHVVIRIIVYSFPHSHSTTATLRRRFVEWVKGRIAKHCHIRITLLRPFYNGVGGVLAVRWGRGIGKNIFEFTFTVDTYSSKLKLFRDISLPFKHVSATIRKEDDQILASTLSADGTLFAVATASKQCFLYDILNDWTEVRPALQLPKTPTALERENFKRNNNSELTDDEENCEGELLLGHVSMVLDIDISNDQRFLTSVDRDEKVRISRYPECYIIHRFCLGHSSYVNSVQSNGILLFSAGGDGTIRVWNIEDGKQIAQCDCFEKNRFAVVIKLAVIFEHCKTAQIITFIQESNNFEIEYLTCSDFIIDITVEDSGVFIFGITKSAVVFGKIDGSYLEPVSDISECIINCLSSVKEILLPLEKKIGFNNVEDYKQRKIERIRRKSGNFHSGKILFVDEEAKYDEDKRSTICVSADVKDIASENLSAVMFLPRTYNKNKRGNNMRDLILPLLWTVTLYKGTLGRIRCYRGESHNPQFKKLMLLVSNRNLSNIENCRLSLSESSTKLNLIIMGIGKLNNSYLLPYLKVSERQEGVTELIKATKESIASGSRKCIKMMNSSSNPKQIHFDNEQFIFGNNDFHDIGSKDTGNQESRAAENSQKPISIPPKSQVRSYESLQSI
ncbi:tRNA (guanine-N(7)-)-methyltransferase non-catalytic subunit [Dirofilaria immitis]|nr:tRNA (guanine-N(7)-)-methyltransferase non-catalytic subunit [Dirofilaria immitis]